MYAKESIILSTKYRHKNEFPTTFICSSQLADLQICSEEIELQSVLEVAGAQRSQAAVHPPLQLTR
ncbi:hypothetical protein E2C01_097369 [Portunus trituberculatus]|uniref:Uncharacterized protein n=1 Tax=Portunus trituberculatus TaxID=210409 RepID=A0A5B7K5I8_PORTR|nr:hypothetical protein [Portunus trituberculatus]